MPVRKVTLESICGGGLPELFQRELSDVMANIADVNTDAEKPRRITITLDIQPGPDRANCAIKLGINSKVMPVMKIAGSLYISAKGEKFEAYSADIRQRDIFEQDEQGDTADGKTKPYVLRKESEASAK